MRTLWQDPRDGEQMWLKPPGFIWMTVVLVGALGSFFVPPTTAVRRTLDTIGITTAASLN